MSGNAAPEGASSPRPEGGAKLVLAVGGAIAASLFGAYVLGVLAPFLLWLLAVAGLLGLLVFFLGIGVTVVLLFVFAVRGPKAAADERQSATIESLLTRQP